MTTMSHNDQVLWTMGAFLCRRELAERIVRGEYSVLWFTITPEMRATWLSQHERVCEQLRRLCPEGVAPEQWLWAVRKHMQSDPVIPDSYRLKAVHQALLDMDRAALKVAEIWRNFHPEAVAEWQRWLQAKADSKQEFAP